MSERRITRRYTDPLDTIWIETARRVGFTVERSSDCFASLQGTTLLIGTPDTLDPDDCLAQMIFHELCHSMIQGPAALKQPDWGLQNIAPGEADALREHAALHLQAHLAAAHGLRDVLAPTTTFRGYYDALPEDPLAGEHPAPTRARKALPRATTPPWGPHVQAALEATRAIVAAVTPFAQGDALLSLQHEK